MMKTRENKERIIIAFHTTSDAILMERLCKENAVKGRLIPVPREISAGCGLAWCSGPGEEERLKAIMKQAGISEKQLVFQGVA